MEVSSRRVLLRHLEPARPLRRCVHVNVEPQINAAAGEQPLMEQESTVGIEQFLKIFNLHKQKKVERISYTRDFLIGLAGCPEAKKRPEYLPDHPIVLPEARDPGQQELGVTQWNGVKEDV
ncbi:uncharacterized protein C8orf88 homolog [Xiphophorus maculatus]|uniref:uncharacterized protein C8orf88 homolog n=1 Tax=Xiphophorus maculatus TaxID=8083 RepID=UPI000293BED4|nr:uncharacterized protein C8orf88 homolog [Xiphophorus maculatus]XP_023187246.1 uncharacterized protein C8orf88 homolog [Xiphophorus maculatus]XP_027868783.1 uncharacterized protein C8orf88 homolog [Xiphophorus couchianus]XP_027868784.1 uncharacterized protein C8orf88 homolog [Xiphophorus couchianus]XP_032413495.1 uncharacterized protein C8orf88 homolog [Xiphophorus hellerii]XP_054903534.1 uncharacterized protein C8orf88 homolog [Poeciliopsis prolifica]